MEDNELEKINLDNNKNDVAAFFAKGILGSIPYIGNITAEIITELIPNQRTDRIVEFLKILEQKVKNINSKVLELKFKEKEFIDLFEDSCFQASRALSEDRLELIAIALANSLTNEEAEHLFAKKLLWLLGEINDMEIIILNGYYYPSYTPEGKQFWEEHNNVLRIPSLTNDATEKEIEEATFKRSFKERLSQLELIKPKYRKPKRGEFPEFDNKTGRIKSSGYEITRMGRMLIDFIHEHINE
jgi:hypothetical protein